MIELEPRNLYFINDITRCLIKLRRIPEAEKYIKIAEQIQENDPATLENKANLLIKKRQIGRAKEICISFLNQNPNNRFFIKLLAQCYYEEANYDQAVKLLDANRNKQPKCYVNYLNIDLVKNYIQLGEYEKAQEVLFEMQQLDIDGMWQSNIMCDLARIERYKGNFEKAKDILAMTDTNSPSVMIQCVWLFLSTGEFNKARSILEKLPESYKRMALKFEARIEALDGNFDKAMSILKKQNIQEDYDYESSVLQKIVFTTTTLKRLKKEPENKNIKQDLQAIYELAIKQRDMTLVHLIEREYAKLANLEPLEGGLNSNNRDKVEENSAEKVTQEQLEGPNVVVNVNGAESKDVVSKIRKRMSNSDISSNEAKVMLESIADDTSISATALKAEIYIRVFSNFKGAKKVIQDRAKQEGTTSKEKRLLQDALAIVERAQKGIPPRELGNIR